MKSTVILFFALLLIMSCTRQSVIEEPVDHWNGYSKFLKECTVPHTLWAHAAQNDITKGVEVGNVSYVLENNPDGIPCLHVTYTCNPAWKMTETHVYAGLLKNMPLNNAKDGMIGNPKVGKFPRSANLGSQGVSTWDCWFILEDLPPYAYNGQYGYDSLMINYGFVVASHCIVRSSSGQVETAWAFGSDKFNDKGWGWYDKYYIPMSQDPFTVLYGIVHSQDSLEIFHLNMTTGAVTKILTEYVGNVEGTCDGAAFNLDSSIFFFVQNRALYANRMNDPAPSFFSGTLAGPAASGTYYNGAYYYVNPDANTINIVPLDDNWMVAGAETELDEIPTNVTVNDIAMNPTGDTLYLLGDVSGGSPQLIKYAINSDYYGSIALEVTSGAQLAYGSDGVLYVIATVIEGGSSSVAYTLNPTTGALTEIDDGHIITPPPGDDPSAFTDLSNGPPM